MWVKRSEWERLIREGATRLVLQESIDRYQRDSLELSHALMKARGRIKELEAGILDMQDRLNQKAKEVINTPPFIPLDDTLFEDEDATLVEQDRELARSEGTTDRLLAEMEE